jgi:predicted nucleic acid-binding protein
MPGADAGSAVLDASIAVRWLVDEVGSEVARGLLDVPRQWLAPHLLLTEVASALRRKVVEGALAAPMATEALAVLLAFIKDGGLKLARDEVLAPSALSLSLEIAHKVPDCIYLVLARAEDVPLATADRQLVRAAAACGVQADLFPVPA